MVDDKHLPEELCALRSIHNMLKGVLLRRYHFAVHQNRKNILFLLDANSNAKLLDLGCSDGAWTLSVARKIGTSQIYGVEVADIKMRKAATRGIEIIKCDFDSGPLPFGDNLFDVVLCNQVIEHLVHIDGFLREIHRVLRSTGYAIISTENLSSIDNLLALSLGYPAFSQSISEEYSIRSPLSPHEKCRGSEGDVHQRVFTYFGLQALLRIHRLKIESTLAAGYAGRIVSKLDPVHQRFITVKVRKT